MLKRHYMVILKRLWMKVKICGTRFPSGKEIKLEFSIDIRILIFSTSIYFLRLTPNQTETYTNFSKNIHKWLSKIFPNVEITLRNSKKRKHWTLCSSFSHYYIPVRETKYLYWKILIWPFFINSANSIWNLNWT